MHKYIDITKISKYSDEKKQELLKTLKKKLESHFMVLKNRTEKSSLDLLKCKKTEDGDFDLRYVSMHVLALAQACDFAIRNGAKNIYILSENDKQLNAVMSFEEKEPSLIRTNVI